ncbi:DNA/RNA non-specific endonuclease, partial [Clavibacter sp. Sh2126]|uniref:DNA/RNA non-specific endonuclease n=1 Tax=Clavibacter sp. Sh2126 TaxID=3397678 RepID=UPI0039E004CC
LRGASILARTGGALEHASTLATDGSRLAAGLSRAGTLTTKVAELLGANPRLALVMTDDETIQAYFRGLATDGADDGLVRDTTLSTTIHDLAEAEKHAEALPDPVPSHVNTPPDETHETGPGRGIHAVDPTDTDTDHLSATEYFPEAKGAHLGSPQAPHETPPTGPHAPTGDDYWKPLSHDEIQNLPVVRDGSHLVDGKLSPNTWYQTGEHEYLYRTNEHGHIDRVIAEDLRFTTREIRPPHDPNTLGKIQGVDHAGHLIAFRYGGSDELDNLVSQLIRINKSRYYRVENQWGRALSADPPQRVSLDLRIDTDPVTGRPYRFEVNYDIDGESFSPEFLQ